MSSANPIPAAQIVRDAGNTITQRISEYDGRNGERSMAHAVQIFNTIVKKDLLTERDGWLFMLALRQARMMSGKPKMDTYVDLSAYAALLGECELSSRAQSIPVLDEGAKT